jgi:hypothetical protein
LIQASLRRVMRSRRVRVAALLALAVASRVAAEEEKPAAAAKKEPSSWYAQRVTSGDQGVAVEHFWSKGRKLHAEIVVQGISVTTLVNGEFYTIVDQTNGSGIRIRRSAEALAADAARPNERPFGREGEELGERGGELVRSDNLAGRPCRVYRLTDDRGKSEVWVTDDKRKLPLRVDFFARESGMQTTTNYIDWLSELTLRDAFFEPDPRVALETIEYAEYVKRSGEGPVGPAPVLFAPLLHGK